MARFFQRTSKSLGKRKLEALTVHADRDVMLLSWLEVALIKSTGDKKSGGKENLFQFAKYLTSKRANKLVK